MNAVIIRRVWGIEPGQFTPELTLVQTIPSTRELGECCVCLRPVLLYQPRDAGFLRVGDDEVLVHFECAEAVRCHKAEPVQPAPAKSPEQLDREDRYRADLWAFHVRTLYTILRMYRELEAADPAAITSDQRWQIAIVRDVYNQRADSPDLFEGLAPEPQADRENYR